MLGVMRWMILSCLLLATLLVSASEPARRGTPPPPGEFHFARMIYTDYPGAGRFGRGWWQQDWPEAEEHFTPNLRRMTRVDVGESVVLRLTDESLFEHPWLYATQTGYWDLSDLEIDRQREYLLRGGILMCDDFRNEDEMFVFLESMTRLFPDRQMVQLSADDAVLHVVFDIDEAVQIPGLRHLGGRGQVQGGLPQPRWYGIYDDHGRLMVGINFNQDVGDSWEHANWAEYPQPMTAQGYRFGVNYVIYAMTH
jgi:hypothetical protein